jgi:hypothetical protein
MSPCTLPATTRQRLAMQALSGFAAVGATVS